MQRKEKIEKEEWNAFVAANAEDGGVLQSWEWGELEEREGGNGKEWKFWRLAWEPAESQRHSGGPATMAPPLGGEGNIVACCLLVERRLSFGWKYLYAPRGPVVSGVRCQVSGVLPELEKFAREQGAVFLRIEPPYHRETWNVKHEALRKTLPIQPQQTIRIDLTQSEDELLKAMHQKTRYNIGLAEKRGVSVSAYTKSDLPLEVGLRHIEIFFNLLQTTTSRDGFRMHPREHYEAILSTLNAKLFFATHEGQPLATALVAFFGNTAYYLHGASANEHRDVMAPYALHWHIMREAKRRGCTVYDLWGVDEKRWPGVTRFKQGFAPTTPFTTYAGTYDLPLRRIPYALYSIRKML